MKNQSRLREDIATLIIEVDPEFSRPLHGGRYPHPSRRDPAPGVQGPLRLDPADINRKAAEQLERTSADRLMLDAIAKEDPEIHLNILTEYLRQSGLYRNQQVAFLVQGWEAATAGLWKTGTAPWTRRTP